MVLTSRRAAWREDAIVAPSLALAALPCVATVTDPDFGWHLAAGRLIAHTHRIPRVDPFSFTRSGAPWTDHEWLTQLALAGLDHVGGYAACAVAFALVAALCAAATWSTARARGAGSVAATIATLLFALLASATTNVRPLMVTTLLCAALRYVCTRAERPGHRAALIAFPAVFALWANLHGGFVVGLALFACIALGDAIDARRALPAVGPRTLGPLFALACVATLVTPWGPSLWVYTLQYASPRNQITRHVSEWAAPALTHPEGLVLALTVVALLVVALLRPRTLRAADALPALVFAALAVRSLRNAPLFAVVALPMLAARVSELVPALARPLDRWRWPVPVALAIAPLLVAVASFRVGSPWQLGARPSDMGYPVAGARWLESRPALARVLAMYHWGGYLIERDWPARRVFIDGRADMYGGAFMDEAMIVFTARPGWAQRLDAWNIEAALVERGSPLDDALGRNAAWSCAFAGPIERVFVRR